MTDFDFEELDKAVTGALGTATDAPARTAPTSPAGERGAISVTRDTPQVAERATEPSSARRSSGRFMDMVHPASDMRTARSADTVPAPAPAATTTDTTAQFSAGPSFAAPPSAFPETAATDLQQPSSPFLPDAKVEKRPLGAPNSTLSYEPLPTWGEDLTDDTASKTQGIEVPEANESTEKSELPADETPEVLTPEPTPDDTLSSQETTAVTPEVEAVEQPVGPVSITQQYDEKPSSSPASGAIYDTESYHQPVAQPAKKPKSGLWVILWIIGLILIGAAVGAAIYLYVLPLL